MDKITTNFTTHSCRTDIVNDWDVLTNKKHISHINSGGATFYSTCAVGTELDSHVCNSLNYMCGLSSFDNESIQNNVPKINLFNRENASKYTIIVIKASYIIPCDHKITMTPEHLSSLTYLEDCNPANPVIEPCKDSTTFRLTRQVIPYVKSLTCQLKVSSFSNDTLNELENLEHYHIDNGILMERTKSNINHDDTTKSIKSILLYTNIPGGFFVSNITIIVNTKIPIFATPLISQLSTYGRYDTSESTKKTRKYFSVVEKYKELIDADVQDFFSLNIHCDQR